MDIQWSEWQIYELQSLALKFSMRLSCVVDHVQMDVSQRSFGF